MNKFKTALSAFASLAGWMLFAADQAAEVHVVQQAKYGETIEQLDVSEHYTGADYQTVTAPVYGGYIFTHWSSSATEGLTARDVFGRSYDAAKFRLYDNVTLTANYVDAALDDDNDGIADGHELYWYGNLDQDADCDTDGDGMTFADELQFGTNPLMSENGFAGVVTGSSDECLYNAGGYPRYVIRSQPEGELFATISGYAKPGTMIVTPTCSRLTSFFSRWETGGQSVRDGFGRAVDSVRFAMPDHDVEYVAVVEENDVDREKLYWYGTTAVSLDSDTDGDGLTLAAEIAAGSNPLMPEFGYSGVVTVDSEDWVYNPSNYQHYVVRSEPEGELFETVSGYKKPGEMLTTPTCDRLTSFFGYWTVNGERQSDAFGRAKDQLSFPIPDEDIEAVAWTVDDDVERDQYYWYGRLQDLGSDTDGDGLTLAEEIAAGTNPLMAEFGYSGVVTADGEDVEMNLQPYEQVGGFVVDGKFLVPELAGRAIWPVVADVNGDGLWDIVVCYGGGTRVFVNVGGKGNPEFEERTVDLSAVDLAMNSTAKLATMALDVEPIGALSATVWGEGTLLVSDDEGRIWYYRGTGVNGEGAVVTYALQHKVWGGSYAGFAQGLRIAVVDWDDDGDLDCLAGTAEGKLMLLRDPKVGRPTNVKALVGVDNVLLEWDPNAQSRIRGYKVYRTDEMKGEGEGEQSTLLASPSLPTYRDEGLPSDASYWYKVSSLSRFYTAGNSTPIESESMPTELLLAEVGKVALRWNDATGFDNEEVKVSLAVENSLNVAGDGLTLEIAYDAAALKPVRVETSGLTEGIAFAQSADGGTWTVRATGGEVAAGGGTLFTFVFEPISASETGVSVRSASMKSVGGATIPVVLPEGGAKVTVAPFVEPEPAHASVTMTESVQVTAGESFEVAVVVSGEGVDAASLAYDFAYDTTLFTHSGNVFTAADVAEAKVSTITLANVSVKATDGTAAVVDSVGSCAVAIAPQAGGDVGSDGDEADDPEQGVVYDKDGELVDWGEEPQEGSAAYGFGFRLVNMSLGSVRGKTDEIVEVPVGIHAIHLLLSTTVDVSRWAFSVTYDADLLDPVGITAVAGEYDWSVTNGVMTVVGKGGRLALGKMLSAWQYPLKLKFRPVAQYARHDADLRFKAVQGRTVEGKRIYTPVRASGGVYVEFVRPADDPTVVVPYGRGDVTGDGRLAKDDLQLMAQLMQAGKGKWNDRQLGAGDYNGNGKLDNDDYQLMRADFRAKGVVSGGEKMGVL